MRRIDAATGIITTIAGTGVAGSAGDGGLATAAQLYGPGGIAVDANNNIYISDENNGKIRKIDATTHNISTYASGFISVERITIDKTGNLYLPDESRYTISKVDASTQAVTIVAGTGVSGYSGDGGLATAAQFKSPFSVAIDTLGNMYVADQPGNVIRRIDGATKIVTTYAGTGVGGYTGDGGSATQATMNFLGDVIIDPAGNLYVADVSNQVIRRIGGTQPSSPLITSFTPASAAAGKTLTLTGSKFTGATAVSFGGISASSFTVVSDTQITAVLGTGASGNISVTTSTGTAIATGFTYVVPIAAPAFSYSSPQTFTENSPAALSPANTGGGINGGTQAISTFASSINGQVAYSVQTGNLYVADKANNVIRQITPAGVVTILAGSGTPGFTNGTGAAASFNAPTGIATSGTSVYVADAGNNVIRKISILATTLGVTTTYSGSGTNLSVDGTATAGSFTTPVGVTTSISGNLYVMEKTTGKIRVVASNGTISTLVTNSLLNADVAITLTSTSNILYVTGTDNIVRSVTTAGAIATVAGSGAAGATNGVGTAASFNNPTGIVADKSGNLYITDSGNNLVRYITLTTKAVTTFAGDGTTGATNSTDLGSNFNAPVNVTVNYSPNFQPSATDLIFVSDGGNNLIRKITTAGYTLTPALPGGLAISATTGTISGTPTAVSAAKNYTVTAYNSGGTATTVVNIAVANSTNAATAPKIYTIAGVNKGTGHTGDGGPATSASILSPYGIARDAAGNLYVVGYGDNYVRKIDAVTKNITTIAGTATAGFSGDGGLAVNAQLNNSSPSGLPGIAVDAAGNIYVSDFNNNRVRKIDATTKIITTIAGTGTAGSLGDGGLATAAQLSGPGGISIDANNNIYICDLNNASIRKIDATTHNISKFFSTTNYVERLGMDKAGNIYLPDEGGTVYKIDAVTQAKTTVAGTGVAGYSGDGGLATSAQLSGPIAVVFDTVGNMYIADQNVSNIRKVDAITHVISTFAGNGAAAYSGDGGAATLASLNFLSDLAIDKSGNLYISDLGNGVIRMIGDISIAQTITFAAIPAKLTTAVDFAPATSSSGLAINYASSNTAVATLVNGKIHVVGAGTATITASQAGDFKYTAATNVQQTLTVTAPSNNVSMTGTVLTVAYTLVKDPSTGNLSATVPATINNLGVIISLADAGAKLIINGVSTIPGIASAAITLTGTVTNIPVKIVSSDETITRTFTVIVTQTATAKSGDYSMTATTLTIPYTLIKNPATGNLAATVPATTNSLGVIISLANAGATMTINGGLTASGVASAPVTLNPTVTNIPVTITAADGSFRSFTVIITKNAAAKSGDYSMAGFMLTVPSVLTRDVASGNFTTTVPKTTSSLGVIITLSDPVGASLTINGLSTTSGTTSAPITLNVATTTIPVTIIAADGSLRTFSVIITKATDMASNFVSQSLALMPSNTEPTDVKVHAGLSPNGDGINDNLQIDGITNFPDNSVKIINRNGELVFDKKGYDNQSVVFDGHSSTGKLQLPGTYFYSVDYTQDNVAKRLTGYIVIKY